MLTGHLIAYNFVVGYILGFFILMLVPSILQSQRYIKRTKGVLRFFALFLWAFVRANVNVAKIILFIPKKEVTPGFFIYNTEGLSHFEVLLVSHCVTLTPGTISVEVSEDFSRLTIHVLHLRDPDLLQKDLDYVLKDSILEFTR